MIETCVLPRQARQLLPVEHVLLVGRPRADRPERQPDHGRQDNGPEQRALHDHPADTAPRGTVSDTGRRRALGPGGAHPASDL